MEKFARRLARKYAIEGIIAAEKEDLFRYGAEIFFSVGGFCLAAILIGCIAGCLIHVLVFLLSFFPLRCVAGGYHADTPEKCLAISLVATMLSLILGPAISDVVALAIYMLSMSCIWLLAPLAHPESPQNDTSRSVLKYRVRCVICIESVGYGLLQALGCQDLAGIMVATVAVVAISIGLPSVRKKGGVL